VLSLGKVSFFVENKGKKQGYGYSFSPREGTVSPPDEVLILKENIKLKRTVHPEGSAPQFNRSNSDNENLLSKEKVLSVWFKFFRL
jgi:hypothetical protein